VDFFQGFEWVIIFLIILLIFGPSKLPQLARGLGQAIYEFRKASQGITEETPPKKEEKKKTEIDEELLKKLAEKLTEEEKAKIIEEAGAKPVLVEKKDKS